MKKLSILFLTAALLSTFSAQAHQQTWHLEFQGQLNCQPFEAEMSTKDMIVLTSMCDPGDDHLYESTMILKQDYPRDHVIDYSGMLLIEAGDGLGYRIGSVYVDIIYNTVDGIKTSFRNKSNIHFEGEIK